MTATDAGQLNYELAQMRVPLAQADHLRGTPLATIDAASGSAVAGKLRSE